MFSIKSPLILFNGRGIGTQIPLPIIRNLYFIAKIVYRSRCFRTQNFIHDHLIILLYSRLTFSLLSFLFIKMVKSSIFCSKNSRTTMLPLHPGIPYFLASSERFTLHKILCYFNVVNFYKINYFLYNRIID